MAQAMALIHGSNPYQLDSAGFVYTHARVPTVLWDAFLDGHVTWDDVVAEMEVKAGHTNDLERRMREYRECMPEYTFLWHCAYATAQRMLLGSVSRFLIFALTTISERLVHLSLRELGAQLKRYPCACGTEHQEYYSFTAAGGLEGLEGVVRNWLWILKDLPMHSVRFVALLLCASFFDLRSLGFPLCSKFLSE